MNLKGNNMSLSPLVQKIIDAHGGLARWQTFDRLTARLRQGGALWAIKGHDGKLADTTVTVGLKSEWASHAPFGVPGKLSRFEPQQVELRTTDGEVLQRLEDPRASFAGHQFDTSWTESQLAYFAGYAMWTYLNLPFLMAYPGVRTEQLEDWRENGETWYHLRITFPDDITTHSRIQTLYVSAAGLLKRHDYDVDIAAGTQAAHYVSDYTEVQGIKFPTRHRIVPRQPDGQSMSEPLVVSIEVSDITLV